MKNYTICSLILVLAFCSIPGVAQVQTPSDSQEPHKEYYFYSIFHDQQEFNRFNSMASVDNVVADTLFAYANEEQYRLLLQSGYSFQLLPHPGSNPQIAMSDYSGRSKGLWDTYPTYEGYLSMMNDFVTTYPNLCELVVFDTLNSGRLLEAIHINTALNTVHKKPSVFYTSTMHGDEVVGYVLMLRLIDHLLTNYGTEDQVTLLVDSLDIWINPLANPDGTYFAGNSSVSGARRYNAAFVDLNRNYPDPENGPHPDGKAWQEETLAFMALAEQEKFDVSVNIHGGAEVCNYPWDTWSPITADDLWWQHVCNEYADTAQFYSPTGYMDDFTSGVINGYVWYTTNGCRQDYMNYFRQCREFTLELSHTKMPAGSELPDFWEYNYRSFLNYLNQAFYSLHGTVTDSLTGDAIEARIYINGHDMDSSWVYSDELGGDYHRYLKAGSYTLSYSAPGYITKDVLVEITDNQRTVLDVSLVADDYIPWLQQVITFPEGWSGFSTWLNLANDSTAVVFEPIGDTLIILKDLTSVYWPPYANNLSHISNSQGYALKMQESVTIVLEGSAPTNTNVALDEGWNYLPVMVPDSIATDVLLSPILEHIIIVKSFTGDGIIWPAVSINTLPWLYSGQTYLIKVDSACEVVF